MFLTYLMLAVALCLSAVAAFYSIAGLAAIFAAAVTPIVIMGSILEVAKLVVTVWLHEYWQQCKLTMKLYLVPAVAVLMIITSMGIFGFLSKAHLDQAVPMGDVVAKLSVYDEKIKIERENIDANRRVLQQMDEAVDQVMTRTTDERGAERSVQIRRSQQVERTRLFREIEQSQQKIAQLNEQRAPVAAEVRKVEAEVGPIKYIAALVYGDDPNAGLLEAAVRWVIIILVVVFDPLAVMMLLAATESRRWELNRQQQSAVIEKIQQPAPVANDVIEPESPDIKNTDTDVQGTESTALPSGTPSMPQPQVAVPETPPVVVDDHQVQDEDQDEDEEDNIKLAKAQWKKDNPGKTLKEQRTLLERGVIDHLPWENYLRTHKSSTRLGRALPGLSSEFHRGDLFVLTGVQPTQLYKFTGDEWIMIDKSTTDQYIHDDAYIEYLIDAVSRGQYDPDLLTEIERTEIENKLKNISTNG